MSDTVLLRVSRSVVFYFGLLAVTGIAILTAAVSVTGAASLSSRDYPDVFCGTPPPTFRPEPVVLPPHAAPMTVLVNILDFAFDPPDLTINVGDTVMWTNNDEAVFHTSSSDTAIWDSGSLLTGQTFSFTFTSPGMFPYHCGHHLFMTANITVLEAPSPTPTPAISGTVTYGNAIGPRFVSNVLLSGVGSPNVSTMTSFPNGTYTLTGFGASSYTVTPVKTDGVNGISSFDAGRIAQHVAGITTLTGNQIIAADTSGNGMVSSFDAGQIARYVAAISGSGSTGTWKFSPINRFYASVSSNVTGEDFVALLMGEVSGNWTNTAPPSPRPTP